MKLSEKQNHKFIEEIDLDGWNVETETGYVPILSTNKTIEYEVYEIILEDGYSIKCADTHILIKDNYDEIYAIDSLNSYIKTKKGNKKVLKVNKLDYSENMYDLSIDSKEHTYYTNDILSHNTVTIATYLLWKASTTPNINVGIAANVHKLAVEVLDKIKKIFIEMPIWLQPGIVSWNKREIEFENGTRIMTSATNSDSFRGFTINILYCDEAGFIRPNLWEEFADAVFPAQEALMEKQTIISSTANGLNQWYLMVEGARAKKNGYKLAEASWKEVPRWKKDGTLKTPEEFKKEVIAKSGVLFFEQNFGNAFLGSSSTLISGTGLKSLSPIPEEEIIFNSLFEGLRIFEEPINGHHYILTSDPKKAGIDAVGIHVIDVTSLPFKQVATAQIDESYLIVPGRLFDLGNYYNQALVVCENNIAESIPSTLFYNYEYEGEVFIEKGKNGKPKKEMGFRTTVKTKRLGLTLMKKFIEEGKLIINDKETVNELFNFIEQKNGTFAAEEGYHDDLVMSLMLTFAPFLDFKNWDDFKGFIEYLEKQKETAEKEEQNAAEFLDLGFVSDEIENESPFTEGVWDFNEFEH